MGYPKSLHSTAIADSNPRYIGSWSANEFPSPLMKFMHCLGIRPHVCPPHRPDKNAFVERFNRSYSEECLNIYHPQTLAEVAECTHTYRDFYNHERPNQAITCGNQPPYRAFPDLAQRPALPAQVDPDRWLTAIHATQYRRRISSSGSVRIGGNSYYISRQLRGQFVSLQVDAPSRTFVVWHEIDCVKQLDIKGLVGMPLDFDEYLAHIKSEAVSSYRRYLYRSRRR